MSRRSLLRRDERGTVTAEAAMVLPALVALAVALAWLVGLGVDHARAVDAAREAARVVARGEATSTAVALARRVAPRDAHVSVHEDDRYVTVDVTAQVRGPGTLVAGLGAVEVHARAVAARESTTSAGVP